MTCAVLLALFFAALPPAAAGCDRTAAEPAAAAAPAPRFAEVRLTTGVRLRYAEQGDPAGEPFILLHGYTDSWFSWSRVLPSLPAAWRVFALDQRGHGDSDRPAEGYALDDFAADVIAFMDAMGLPRATLVGHSMGSFVAQRVALGAPERVARLVLVGSATTVRNEVVLELERAVDGLTDPVPVEFVREFQLSTVREVPPAAFLDEVIATSLRVPARVWRGVMAGMLAAGPATGLGRAAIPTLILWGDHDAVFGRAEQEALRELVPGAVFVEYPETGHAPHWERPERFVRDLAAFVAAAAGGYRPGGGVEAVVEPPRTSAATSS